MAKGTNECRSAGRPLAANSSLNWSSNPFEKAACNGGSSFHLESATRIQNPVWQRSWTHHRKWVRSFSYRGWMACLSSSFIHTLVHWWAECGARQTEEEGGAFVGREMPGSGVSLRVRHHQNTTGTPRAGPRARGEPGPAGEKERAKKTKTTRQIPHSYNEEMINTLRNPDHKLIICYMNFLVTAIYCMN